MQQCKLVIDLYLVQSLIPSSIRKRSRKVDKPHVDNPPEECDVLEVFLDDDAQYVVYHVI